MNIGDLVYWKFGPVTKLGLIVESSNRSVSGPYQDGWFKRVQWLGTSFIQPAGTTWCAHTELIVVSGDTP